MWASTIESPRTRRTYASPLGASISGTDMRLARVLVGLDRAAGGDLADDGQDVDLWRRRACGTSSEPSPPQSAAVGVRRSARERVAPRSR